MASLKQQEMKAPIIALISKFPEGARLQDILEALSAAPDLSCPPRRTLQSWLKRWVESGELSSQGVHRGTRYFAHAPSGVENTYTPQENFPFSALSQKILRGLRLPTFLRPPVAYDFNILDNYRPNESNYLTAEERALLNTKGKVFSEQPAPAGTFARQLLNRFLIDLSWNSSRLEGNTYSLLDTRRLLHFGATADGKAKLEAQMILNHKDAIEFLVENAEDIGFNRHTLLNLHGLLSNNLLENPQASGRLRTIDVGIGRSVFQPLAAPRLIELYFEQILATASTIHDPFEQSFFALVHLPYLQAFDDVNKRVSRLAANIPLIKQNLIPLSFIDMPKDAYIEAILALYEKKSITPLKEVFIWAYQRSVHHYQVVRQTLGEPDEFRLRYRNEIKTIVLEVVQQLKDKRQAYVHIIKWMKGKIPDEDQAQFRESVETELLALHEGNFARFKISPVEFDRWVCIWQNK